MVTGCRAVGRQTGRETETVGHVGRQSCMWADRDSQAGRQADRDSPAGRQTEKVSK